MLELIERNQDREIKLEEYEQYATLLPPLMELRKEARLLIPKIGKRRLWMINSTSQGGGVAEMLPRMISVFEQVGLEIKWAVINTQKEAFFDLTKKIHNLIHGLGDDQAFSSEEKELFEEVNAQNAQDLIPQLAPDDIVVIHDPQPIALIKHIKDHNPNQICVWRCHIGLDRDLPATQAVWTFLKPYLKQYDHSIFTASEYIPDYISANVSLIPPSIAPLSPKNKYLFLNQVAEILQNAGLSSPRHQVSTPAFGNKAKRIQPQGEPGSPLLPQEIDWFYAPVILEVSRWDHLKGFAPLLQGFVHLKNNIDQYSYSSDRHRKAVELLRLVMAGPDPAFVHDDPEGQAVLKKLTSLYQSQSEEIQAQIAILQLPMQSADENALIVNALQRCSTIVAQNSLQEGFGLTVTEAMWKTIPILGTRACGIRQQIREGIDGILIKDAKDPVEIAQKIHEMLSDPEQMSSYAHQAEKRVLEEFLVFSQVRRYLNLTATLSQRD